MLLAVGVVVAGLLVHGVLPDTAATDIAGDALYALLIHLLVVACAPGLRPMLVGAVAAGWCVAIELLQLSSLPGGAARIFPPAMLVLGTVFDARDLVVYIVTVAAAVAADAAWQHRPTHAQRSARSNR
ncbi:DUF2809 domain-containing protein [Microbacterium sp. cf332]|uniref:ribosomal maturation YjgA family protein n=1 Tax=Microbacterium sp. cf332 TaxID=1761804 RepID=UPI00088F55A8|nr:DUF2809 domain-containing protein [Microbacterium sp. cf332]SDQ75263.1 Protein of unknown function [Microbacterium sp. cf332]